MLLLTLIAKSQLSVVPFEHNKLHAQPAAKMTASVHEDTINLPFFDNFSESHIYPDSSKWLSSSGTFISNRFCENPPSPNCATFDGLTIEGTPYFFPEFNGVNTVQQEGITDVLTSQHIDLSGFSESDQLALSFFWQKGGIEDEMRPNPSTGDSLSLFFLAKDTLWRKAWPISPEEFDTITNAPNGQQFNYQFVEITDSIFFHEGFQFKFETFGRQSGYYDMWQIDNVELNNNRDTEAWTNDMSSNKIPTSLFKEFSAIPIDHFLEDPESFLSDTIYSQLINAQYNRQDFANDGPTQIVAKTANGEQQIIQGTTDFNTTNLIEPMELFETYWSLDKSAIAQGIVNALASNPDYMVLETTISVNGSDNITNTDSISVVNTLENYLSYDDGTPELGISMKGYGELALEYNIIKDADLIGIDFLFPKFDFDLSVERINIHVWSEIYGPDNQEGSVSLIEDGNKASLKIEYPDTLFATANNDLYDFTTIYFEEPISIPAGKFYVGYDQNTETNLPIGLDKSSDHLQKMWFRNSASSFFSQDFEFDAWGNIMIRPRFGDKVLSIFDKSDKQESLVYPNPSSGTIYINEGYRLNAVYDLNGIDVTNEIQVNPEERQLEFSGKGLYLLELKNQRDEPLMQKVFLE